MVIDLERLLSLPIVWLGVVVGMLLIRSRVIAWAQKRAVSSESEGDKRAAALLNRIYMPALLLFGAYLTMEILPLPERWAGRAEKTLAVLSIVIAFWIAWRGFSLLLHRWAETNPNAGTLIPPVQLVGRLLLVMLGIIAVLSALDYSPTKVWTALGIGSIAIALALQETLSNIFAGFHLMLDQPVRIGDYIRLDTGEEGRVLQIGWRSTRLVALANNVVVIPNSKLARASITNFTLPVPRMAFTLPVSVSYDSDPRRVCQVLEEVAVRASHEVEGMLSDPAPVVRFIPGFGDHSLDFSISCHVRDFVAQYAVQDELRQRLFERLRQEGIEIPFPVRQLLMKQAIEKMDSPPVRDREDPADSAT